MSATDPMKKKRKVIFLDIDGVLQHPSSQERFKHDLDKLREKLAENYGDEELLKTDKYDLGAVYYDWFPEAINNLRRLIEMTNSEIVISSSWRRYSPLSVLKKFFRIHNLDQFITGATPVTSEPREMQIKTFIDENKDIEQFVIIDDRDLSEVFPDHFVYTRDYFTGMHYEQALKILSST